MDNLICLLICAKVQMTTIKHETIEPPKVEQTTRQENTIRTSNARQIKNIPTTDVTRTIQQHFGNESAEVLEIVRRESTFNPKAINKSSGACGLFQSLPCKKMNCSLDDVVCQVKWGKSYIKSRYGSAERALAFHDRMGWY